MRDLAPCGTAAAAARHRYHDEDLDAACVEAENRARTASHIRTGKAASLCVSIATLKKIAVSHQNAFDELCHDFGHEVALAIVGAPRRSR